MQRSRVGMTVFAASLIGLGVLGLLYGDFALVWQPVPSWVPGRAAIAYACALASFASGLGLLWRRTAAAAILCSVYARLAAAMITGMMAAFTLLVWVTRVVAAPADRMQWTGLAVSSLLTAGSWVVADTYRGIPWLAARPLAPRTYATRPL